jgi:hypothetical protein
MPTICTHGQGGGVRELEEHNKVLEEERHALRQQLAHEQTRVDKLKASIRAALDKQVTQALLLRVRAVERQTSARQLARDYN